MTKRKIKKAFKRILNLPGGISFFRYLINKAKYSVLRKQKSLEITYPSSIMIELTNHCNLKCITCPREYIYGGEMDKGYINIENFKKIIDEICPYVDSIGLTGLGETFLYKNIFEAVDYIRSKSKGTIISCSINAHLKNSVETASKLAGKIDTIQISVDGIGDVYNKVRIRGDYNFFIENVRGIADAVKNSGTDLMFNMVVLKENYFQMTEVLKLCSEIGVGYLNIIPMNIVSMPDMDKSYYGFYRTEEFKNEVDRINKSACEHPEVELTLFDFDSEYNIQNCRFFWNYFYITWDGYVPPCCAKPFPKELNFGNVFGDGVLNVLNSKSVKAFRKLWYQKKSHKFCDKCFYVDYN